MKSNKALKKIIKTRYIQKSLATATLAKEKANF
jgi:hypothetical protein